MAIKSWTATGNGSWSTSSAWTPNGAPANGDTVLIGNTNQVGALTVTEDATLAIASLTLAGNHKANQGTTLSLTQANTLTVNGPLVLNAEFDHHGLRHPGGKWCNFRRRPDRRCGPRNDRHHGNRVHRQ